VRPVTRPSPTQSDGQRIPADENGDGFQQPAEREDTGQERAVLKGLAIVRLDDAEPGVLRKSEARKPVS
jgi:hypothetical protein